MRPELLRLQEQGTQETPIRTISLSLPDLIRERSHCGAAMRHGAVTAACHQKQWWTVGETTDRREQTADLEERLGG